MNSYQQRFSVSFDYPVLFTREVFTRPDTVLADAIDRLHEGKRHRVIAFIDSGLVAHHRTLPEQISQYASLFSDRIDLVRPPSIVQGGETIKNDYRLIMEILDTILEYQLCRHSVVLAVGGGAVLDAVGFAASLVHRGLRVVRMPTTVLAQNDAGVGVKTGMNLHGGKNTIGTFHPPFAVINDFSFLSTLDNDAWLGGIAEAYKVAIIKDSVFFEQLVEDAALLGKRDPDAMERLIVRCAELHLEHIAQNGDPFEYGRARPLDFGHWSAHKLESMTGYRVGHGIAVGIGIALDSYYAFRQGWLSESEFSRIMDGLDRTGFALWDDTLKRRLADGTLEILGGVNDFREHLGGELCLTFPHHIGHRREEHHIDPNIVEAGIALLQSRRNTNRADSKKAASAPDLLP